ncbi:serine/threonine protein kinase [Scheffersomyces stipitis CBS 6054]|uniref:non-specific serine/threonine protein kinase n=1 Tax=Scheffersomyces stipitis (strain ATCC 58785 / CBS 6054 / NBRC 10063 / NRRL Y-11545) TaxID=322104 RepID=A3LUB0_PICST|nr:serine/threonine protein kinase [Scheffersomyces stipitis CBS 6054]ABN66556.2 serine/threonine protein kinase [Scheffersomyces stipitis CBS 6054]
MNGASRVISDQNQRAQLAAQFNDFYLHITSPNVTQIGNYRIIEEIGEGAFGKVYLAKHVLLNIEVVLKCGLVDDPNIVREIYYHKQLKHKNIVSLYEVIKTESHLWLVLEYCQGGELFYYIYEKKRLDYRECQHLFFQIVLALRHVHSLNLSHRDLKLENILLADKKRSIVKITDFGFVREFDPSNRRFLSTICGTTVYMAPELLKNEKYSGFASDIWALGVILFTMIYGEMPFDEDDDLRTKYKIVNEEPFYRDNIPQHLVQLIQKMLSKDPNERPHLNDILNSQFLIDIHNKFTERDSKKYNDTESIISIHQYYSNCARPFQSKVEKEIIKRLQKLNFDIDELQACVYSNDMNSLTAFYELMLTQEFSKKKRKYYREKQKKYYEAKRTLRKSRKRVKSALSLSDSSVTGNAPPLERIISSLSLSSNRNGSRAALNKTVESRMSSDGAERRSSHTRTASGSGPTLRIDNNGLLNVGSSPGSPTSTRSRGAPDTPRERENSHATVETGPPLQRIVSFVPEDNRRRSDISVVASNEPLKKKIKNGNFLNKIQFWKKSRKEEDLDSNYSVHSRQFPKSSTDYSNEKNEDRPLEITINRSSPSRDMNDVNSGSPHAEHRHSERHSGPLMENFTLNQPALTMRKDDSIEDPAVSLTLNETNSPTPPVTDQSGSRTVRTRPTSMISQMSQVSHLSQMSTMMSESELDILDETDTMDDEYDDDDDGAYESSLNISQDFTRHSSTAMTPTSSFGANAQSKYASAKKRPGYKRNGSDFSLKSGSTSYKHNKKFSLSQLSSNSSEESSIKSNSNFVAPIPTKPTIASTLNGDLDGTLTPTHIARANSPDLAKGKTKKRWNPIFSDNITSNSYNQSSSPLYGNGQMMDYRAHSPPPNKMNTKYPVKTLFDQKKQAKTSPSPGYVSGPSPKDAARSDTRWEPNFVSTSVVGSFTAPKSGFEPVNEEDENEY